jgi:hypothetical protein
MTTNTTDPNSVVLTGENSFIRLSRQADGPNTTRISHWRILLSPMGPGHVLYIKSDAADDEVRIYSDNIGLARWLQGEIETHLFPEFADESIPVVEAAFTRSGNAIGYWTETVESDEDTISMSWYDFMEPFMITVPAGSVEGRPHGVYSCFIPARRAQLTINGLAAQGQVVESMRGDQRASSACIAWSETWVKP